MEKAKKKDRSIPVCHPTILDNPEYAIDSKCVECGGLMHSNWQCRLCYMYPPDERYVTKICRVCHARTEHKMLEPLKHSNFRKPPMHTFGIDDDPDAFKKATQSA